jgi:AmiR/NasT family two-component response regulator
VLTNAQAFAAAQRLAQNLERAIDSRAVIEQAKGIIMSTRRCSPDAAFQLLRTQSQYENRKLRDVAQEVVQAAAGPTEPDGPDDRPGRSPVALGSRPAR